MKNGQKFVSLLLGVVLLVQGVAVSAAQCDMDSERSIPAAMSGDDSGMPCHGTAGEQAGAEQSSKAQGGLSCCDEDCPNMASCMLGHVAINTAFILDTSHSPEMISRPVVAGAIIHSPPSLLRPPISLHG